MRCEMPYRKLEQNNERNYNLRTLKKTEPQCDEKPTVNPWSLVDIMHTANRKAKLIGRENASLVQARLMNHCRLEAPSDELERRYS